MSHWTPTYAARLAAGASSVGIAVDTCIGAGELVLRAVVNRLSVVLAGVRRRLPLGSSMPGRRVGGGERHA